jgi:thiosulfate/3-mercaptopyruvate sulfurtransferase
LFTHTALATDIISAQEVAKIMKDENVVIVSAQKASSYNEFHITGSINLSPSLLVDNEPIEYMSKAVSEMERIIGEKGVSNTNLIIVYDEGSFKYSGRLYWVLKYLGVENVKILDGGLIAWKAIRKPVTSAPTTRKATTFTANVQPQFLANLSEVKKATTDSNYVIVDARSEAEYTGTGESKLRPGHIPNAISVSYSELIAESGELKSAEQLAELYTSRGITPDKTVIIYCTTSVRAAIEFAALNSILGYENVKVFDGAYTEWAAQEDTEVVR